MVENVRLSGRNANSEQRTIASTLCEAAPSRLLSKESFAANTSQGDLLNSSYSARQIGDGFLGRCALLQNSGIA